MPFRNRHTGSRTPLRRRHTGPGPTCFQAEPTTEAVFTCVPHAMDCAACCMSQGLSLLPTLPVRANCRPDLHLGRLPVLPACVLHALSGIVIPVGVRSPASWLTTASRCHATNTLTARPLTERDGTMIIVSTRASRTKREQDDYFSENQKTGRLFRAQLTHRRSRPRERAPPRARHRAWSLFH